MTKWNGRWHPLAERFPTLSEDELRRMAESVREHGQFVPCRMTSEGLGLDGRNRVAACALAGTEPKWEVFDGNAFAFIVEINAERRHLTTGQRAMATAIGLAEEGLRSNGRFKRGSVPEQGDNARSSISESAWANAVRQAGVVLDHAPQLADKVLLEGMALDEAYKKADDVRKRKRRLEKLDAENSALVEAKTITLAEAERRMEEAKEAEKLEERLQELPDDLAERVRDETLDIDEAELVVKQRDERLEKEAEQVGIALSKLRGLVGTSTDGLAEKLDESDRRDLKSVLEALKENSNVSK